MSLPSLKVRCLVRLASIAPVQPSSWHLIEASDPVGEQGGSDTTWPEPRAARIGGAAFQGQAQHGGGRGAWQSGRDSLQETALFEILIFPEMPAGGGGKGEEQA